MTWCFQTKPAKEAVSACSTASSLPGVLQGSLNGTHSDKCLGVILTCGWNLARFNPRRGGCKQTPALLRETSPTGDNLDGLSWCAATTALAAAHTCSVTPQTRAAATIIQKQSIFFSSSAISSRTPEDEKPAESPQLQKHSKQNQLSSHTLRLFNNFRAPFLQIRCIGKVWKNRLLAFLGHSSNFQLTASQRKVTCHEVTHFPWLSGSPLSAHTWATQGLGYVLPGCLSVCKDDA